MKRKLDIRLTIIFLAGVTYVSFFAGIPLKKANATEEVKKVIVVDAGHGGNDPGKVSGNNVLEKDVNLQIATKLANELENAGFKVIMTRTEDNGLYKEDDVNKKAADLRARCEIAEEENADLLISIHQNSFSDSNVRGGQTFYYTHSVKGKKMASLIQKHLKSADKDNTREAKANDSYYLLIHTPCICVIVECGFLSNAAEAELLVSDEYQNRLADSITDGVKEYFEVTG